MKPFNRHFLPTNGTLFRRPRHRRNTLRTVNVATQRNRRVLKGIEADWTSLGGCGIGSDIYVCEGGF